MKGNTHLFSDNWYETVLKPELPNIAFGMLKWLPEDFDILIAKKFNARKGTFYKVINGEKRHDSKINYLNYL